jgi:hypothetical protein
VPVVRAQQGIKGRGLPVQAVRPCRPGPDGLDRGQWDSDQWDRDQSSVGSESGPPVQQILAVLPWAGPPGQLEGPARLQPGMPARHASKPLHFNARLRCLPAHGTRRCSSGGAAHASLVRP